MESSKISSELNTFLTNTDNAIGAVIADYTGMPSSQVSENPPDEFIEVIVKYNGSLSFVETDLNGTYTELLGGFGIVTISPDNIKRLSEYRQIEYIELPKRIFFEVENAKAASCIPALTAPSYSLTGKGVLMAIIDSGIDYTHPDFINQDNTTRILRLWDQTTGMLYDSSDINTALASPDNRMELINETDISGHGTHVAGIAAGNGRASRGRYTGVATECSLLIIKLGSSTGASFPRTTNLMTAVDYAIRTSLELNMPLVINLSFGNTYGPHDGSSLTERFINICAGYSKTSIVIAAGNEGAAAGHISGNILSDVRTQSLPDSASLSIGSFEPYLTLNFYKNFSDDFRITLTSPSGISNEINAPTGTSAFYSFPECMVFVLNSAPTPLNTVQELFFVFVPYNAFLPSGIWRFDFSALSIVSGDFDIYLPASGSLNPGTAFLTPDPYVTLTTPSGAFFAITVGAYNSALNSYADFSGRGFTRNNIYVKPDIAAPGVNILSAAPGGGYTVKSGTSMAAPFVSGTAALLMEWGIVNGNDPYMYGEKLKAYLLKGAKPLAPGASFDITNYPNPLTGWGVLCAGDSLPDLRL